MSVLRPVAARAALAATTVVVLALSACSSVGGEGSGSGKDDVGSAAEDVKEGGTLVVALAGEPDFLDPTVARTLLSRYIFNAICEKLYDVDKDAHVVPQLAADMPETSDDGTTVTIPLRDGVKFADGTPFNSAAVKKSLERHFTKPDSGRTSEMGPIAGIETPDDMTVEITLDRPFTPLTAALSDRAGMVMSPKQLDAKGDDFSSEPVCVGPFKLEKRVPQSSVELVPDPNYYDKDKVHLDRIVYRIITDANIRAANLESDDVQVADALSTDSVPDLSSSEAVKVLQSDSLGYQGITFNVGNVKGVGEPTGRINKPWATSEQVRQAFSAAVDRKALVETTFNDLFAPACSAVAPQSEYTSDLAQTCLDADPAEAKRLLQEAGVKTPVKMELLITNTPVSLRFGQALQAQVKEGGFELKLVPAEFTSLLDLQDQGKYEAVQIGWSGRVDPDANLTNFVGTGGSQNVAGYSNPELDAVLDEVRGEGDKAKRAELYGQVAEIVNQDAPLVYLYRQRNLTGVSSDLEGVQVYPDGLLRVAFAGFKK